MLLMSHGDRLIIMQVYTYGVRYMEKLEDIKKCEPYRYWKY